MSSASVSEAPTFQERVAHLTEQLEQFAQKDLDPTVRDELALDILCDRDTLQVILKDLAKHQQLEAATVSEIDALDRRLATLDSKFLAIAALPRWRDTFDPGPNAWIEGISPTGQSCNGQKV